MRRALEDRNRIEIFARWDVSQGVSRTDHVATLGRDWQHVLNELIALPCFEQCGADRGCAHVFEAGFLFPGQVRSGLSVSRYCPISFGRVNEMAGTNVINIRAANIAR